MEDPFFSYESLCSQRMQEANQIRNALDVREFNNIDTRFYEPSYSAWYPEVRSREFSPEPFVEEIEPRAIEEITLTPHEIHSEKRNSGRKLTNSSRFNFKYASDTQGTEVGDEVLVNSNKVSAKKRQPRKKPANFFTPRKRIESTAAKPNLRQPAKKPISTTIRSKLPDSSSPKIEKVSELSPKEEPFEDEWSYIVKAENSVSTDLPNNVKSEDELELDFNAVEIIGAKGRRKPSTKKPATQKRSRKNPVKSMASTLKIEDTAKDSPDPIDSKLDVKTEMKMKKPRKLPITEEQKAETKRKKNERRRLARKLRSTRVLMTEEEIAESKRKQSERRKQARESMSEEAKAREREIARFRKANERAQMTEEELKRARENWRLTTQIKRAMMTPEEREKARERSRIQAAKRRAHMAEEKKAEIRERNKKRAAQRRAEMEEEEKEKVKEKNRIRARVRRMSMPEEEAKKARKKACERQAARRKRLTHEQLEKMRKREAARKKNGQLKRWIERMTKNNPDCSSIQDLETKLKLCRQPSN